MTEPRSVPAHRRADVEPSAQVEREDFENRLQQLQAQELIEYVRVTVSQLEKLIDRLESFADVSAETERERSGRGD